MAKIIKHDKEVELKSFVVESLMKSDSANFRDVDSAIDYISNLFDSLSETISILYKKKILDIRDIKRITNNQEIKPID
ncbi:MAG: hypothetical protein PF445_09230 [Melioribacteraceae bacterium]|jgi:hypothetical protein|nr:hypothetical protein [Melioribacteraceae bacterium]